MAYSKALLVALVPLMLLITSEVSARRLVESTNNVTNTKPVEESQEQGWDSDLHKKCKDKGKGTDNHKCKYEDDDLSTREGEELAKEDYEYSDDVSDSDDDKGGYSSSHDGGDSDDKGGYSSSNDGYDGRHGNDGYRSPEDAGYDKGSDEYGGCGKKGYYGNYGKSDDGYEKGYDNGYGSHEDGGYDKGSDNYGGCGRKGDYGNYGKSDYGYGAYDRDGYYGYGKPDHNVYGDEYDYDGYGYGRYHYPPKDETKN